MTDIQLIATDLDGTFLSDDKTFDKSLFNEVISGLKKQNIYFTIATGVHQTRIQRIMAGSLDGSISYVTNNGARVVRFDGKVLYEQNLSLTVLQRIQELLMKFSPQPDSSMIYSTENTAYVPREFKALITEKQRHYFQSIIIINDVSDIQEPILKVTMNWKNFNEETFYREAKRTLGSQVHITETGTGAIDIVPAGVNKAVGLKILADDLGVNMQQIAAFGDGGNDEEMLRSVGYPYIMPKTKLTGHFNQVAYDNNHNGVLRTILNILKSDDV